MNVADVSKIAAHVKGKKLIGTPANADLNGDGKVTVSDIALLAAYLKGKKKL